MEALLDTSVLIDFLRKNEKAKDIFSQIEDGKIKGFISVMTEAELFSGKEAEIEKKRNAIVRLIELFKKIDVDDEIAKIAGNFRRHYNVPLLDCIIAATAFSQDLKIWTKDVKDFKNIKEVKVEEPY